MKILLLAGGDSSEREISLKSSAAIYKALQTLGHEIRAIDPSTGKDLIDQDGNFLIESKFEQKSLFPARPDKMALTLSSKEHADVDVVVIGLHGGSGENGTIQNLLDLAGQKYTGSGMAASVVAMNKALAKRVAQSEKILTPPWKLYRQTNWLKPTELKNDILRNFRLPVIVKPNDSGSTVGVTKVNEKEQLDDALKSAFNESPDVLVEKFIAGREMTVAVLDGRSFPVVEIKPKNELYDYEAKYTSGKSEYIAPAKISKEVSEALREAASKVYEMIGARGAARIDFILAEDDEFYFLEINTLPGMTNLSLVPMAAACEGIDFDRLVEMMIQSALK